MKIAELEVLAPRVKELGQILIVDSITALCDKISYTHFEYTSYMSQSELAKDLVAYIKSKEIPRKYVFDEETQAKALNVLERVYDFKCDTEVGHLLTENDTIVSLTMATGCTYDVAEGFFRQHYTKRGVVC